MSLTSKVSAIFLGTELAGSAGIYVSLSCDKPELLMCFAGIAGVGYSLDLVTGAASLLSDSRRTPA